MITFFFRLETSKKLKDGTHPIYLCFKGTEGEKTRWYRHYTGRSAAKKHWLGKGNKKRVSATAPLATATNSRLEYLYTNADAVITNAKNLQHDLTIDYIKARFEKEVLGKPEGGTQKPVLSFYDHLKQFIASKANIFQPATLKTYTTLLKSLQEFEKATGYKVDFGTINSAFHTLYTQYLIVNTGVINNTIAKRIATLKAFLGEMKKQKVNTYTDFEDFTASRDYDTTLMHLTEKELMQLEGLKLKPNSTEDHVRDVFCFASHTGLRYSDWEGRTPDNIQMVKHEGVVVPALVFMMIKVHKKVTVPLDDYAMSIITKYKDHAKATGRLFPVYSNQETNRTLKAIAKDAGIDDVIIEVKKSGANRKDHTNAKHEILTCHDARNTYATLYLERGGRPEVLKNLLGHSEIKQTMRYVKITEKAVFADHIKLNANTGKVVKLKKPA
jgi:site-specific recombinase XerD